MTLRSLSACLAASAFLFSFACSKNNAGSDATTPDDSPSTESNVTGGNKTQNASSSSGSSGDVPDGTETPIDIGTDPGTTTSSSGGTTTDPDAVSAGIDFSDVKITVNGQARHYVLAVPKNYDANKAYPLIIGLHGDGGNAKQFVTESKLTAAAGDKAIIAFPDQVLDLFTSYYDNNDQRLVAATIIQVKKNRNIDAGKIWGFGYSKGAFMLNEMGCRKPGLFTAIAPHAGGAPQEQDDNGVNCPEATGLAVFATMGTNDDLGGGQFQTDYWAGLSNCSTSKSTTQQGTAPATCQAYKNCDQPVVFCKVQGFGHTPLYASAATDSWNWFNSL